MDEYKKDIKVYSVCYKHARYFEIEAKSIRAARNKARFKIANENGTFAKYKLNLVNPSDMLVTEIATISTAELRQNKKVDAKVKEYYHQLERESVSAHERELDVDGVKEYEEGAINVSDHLP